MRSICAGCERLGYMRFWFAEHHGMPNIALLGARDPDRARRLGDVDASASAPAASCCRTTRRCASPRTSTRWRRCIRAGSTSASGARREPTRRHRARCTRSMRSSSRSSCRNCSRFRVADSRRVIRSPRFAWSLKVCRCRRSGCSRRAAPRRRCRLDGSWLRLRAPFQSGATGAGHSRLSRGVHAVGPVSNAARDPRRRRHRAPRPMKKPNTSPPPATWSGCAVIAATCSRFRARRRRRSMRSVPRTGRCVEANRQRQFVGSPVTRRRASCVRSPKIPAPTS